MKKITYGAPGLVDWVATIKAGAANVRVHFSGGALTQYGVTPAEYTTSNPFIQKIIEGSAYYKAKRIITVRETELPDANAVQMSQNKKSAPKPAPVAEQTQVNENKSCEEPTAEAQDGLTKVEASCLQDAQAYLQEHFSISSYKVRTYEAAQKAAAEHGVRFTGAKFDSLGGTEATE